MEKNKILILVLILFVSEFFVVNYSHAASIPYWGPVMSCNTKRLETGQFSDPCRSLCDILATLKNIIYLGITILLFVIAPAAFVIGGIILVTSSGNESRTKTGRSIVTNTIGGVVVALCAFIIINTLIMILAPKISGNVNLSKWNEIQCNPGALPGTIKEVVPTE